jgi:hypothetical protein
VGGSDGDVDRMLQKHNAKPNEAFSACVEAIQKATICQLKPIDKWKEDRSLIQL